jgi:hypothetical protein
MQLSHEPRREHRFPLSPLVHVRNLLRPLSSNDHCLESRYLATGLHAAVFCRQLWYWIRQYVRIKQINFLKYLWVRRMPSPGMWCRVDLTWTDVSEERVASIFRVENSASDESERAGGCSHVSSKLRFTQDLHGATSQKTTFFIVTAVKTSNLTSLSSSFAWYKYLIFCLRRTVELAIVYTNNIIA